MRLSFLILLAVGCASPESPQRLIDPADGAGSDTVGSEVPAAQNAPTCLPEWARGAALLMEVRSQGDRRFIVGEEERVEGSWDMEASFRLLSLPESGGTLLEQWDFSGWRGEPLAPITFATLYVLHRIRGIHVDAQGVVVGIEGAGEAKAEAEAVFTTREGIPAGSLQTWEMASSPAGLLGQAVQWWQLFSILSCADLAQGTAETGISNDSAWLPGMDDVPVAIDAEVAAVSCPAGGQGCERRTLSVRPDAARTLAVLHEQMSAQGVNGAERVAGFALRRVASGVFDANGLPVELSLLKETTSVHVRPGEAETMTQVDANTSTYRFAPLPGPTL